MEHANPFCFYGYPHRSYNEVFSLFPMDTLSCIWPSLSGLLNDHISGFLFNAPGGTPTMS